MGSMISCSKELDDLDKLQKKFENYIETVDQEIDKLKHNKNVNNLQEVIDKLKANFPKSKFPHLYTSPKTHSPTKDDKQSESSAYNDASHLFGTITPKGRGGTRKTRKTKKKSKCKGSRRSRNKFAN